MTAAILIATAVAGTLLALVLIAIIVLTMLGFFSRDDTSRWNHRMPDSAELDADDSANDPGQLP